MNTFTTTNRTSVVVDHDRETIWEALVDPGLLARMTPFLRDVRDLGDGHWLWELHRIPYPGSHFYASFTERMSFQEPERIDFAHAPGAAEERAGANGWYTLEPRSDGLPGTVLTISVEVSAILPVPAWGRATVTTAMDAVLMLMGQRFGHNLLTHLERTRP